MITSRETVLLSEIRLPEPGTRARRPTDPGDLVRSIAAIGLLNPLVVTVDLELVAGYRRYLALQRLEWTEVPVLVTDAPHRLVEIDENLIRTELTTLERAEHLAERKALYEELHPETKHGANQHTRGEDDEPAPRFTTDTAAATGESERTIRRQVAIGEALTQEARDIIRGHAMADNQRELLRLSKVAAPDQARVARLVTEGKAAGVRAARHQIEALPPPPDAALLPIGLDLRCCTVEALLTDLEANTDLRFGFMTADPPWNYDNQGVNGAAVNHYTEDGSGAEEAAAPGMPGIVAALNRAYALALPDTYLLLWCTAPMLREWFLAEEAGGLQWRYLSGGGWHKDDGKTGIGHHWRGDIEIPLLYAKGKPEPRKTVSNGHAGPRGQHSEKPLLWLYDLLAAFALPHRPVLDLYAGRAPMARAAMGLAHHYVGAESDPKRHGEALQAIADRRKAGLESQARLKG